MKYIDFCNEKISRLGFGLMRLPVKDNDQSKIDYEKTEEMFLYAVEHGINYFDTAFPYHNGFSEITLGNMTGNNHMRSKVNIATKLFTLGMENPDYDPMKMFETQLKRLKTDYIDFYLIHGLHGEQWNVLKRKFNIEKFLNEMRANGVIRHMGFSFHDDYDRFVSILDDYDWEFAQIQYNYLDNKIQAGDKGIAYALSKNIPLNVMEPLKGGNLSFCDYPQIRAILDKNGLSRMTGAELAFRYVFDKKGLGVVLSGMSEISQLRENIDIVERYEEGSVKETEMKAIEQIRKFLSEAETVPCTECRYCVEGCPENIKIPTAFSLYNNGIKFSNKQAQMRGYDRDCANISNCRECSLCEEACPQHLEIPKLLKKVREYFDN